MDGSICERPHIHVPFKLSLQYRILKNSPYHMVPSFQIYNDDTRQRKSMSTIVRVRLYCGY